MTDRIFSQADILSQAEALGFVCECDLQGSCQILPPQKTERWKLQQVEDRWLLLVGNVPQINCRLCEVMIFLERRWLSYQNQEDTEPSP
jgi:hypothetical protein